MILLKNIIKEMAIPSENHKNMIWYHGTSKEEFGKSILNDGFIKPPEITFKKSSQLTPVRNRVYITTDLEYALTYALGANMVGNDLSGWTSATKEGKYGYLFVIDGKELTNIQPDEDVIGEIPMFLNHTQETYNEFNRKLLGNVDLFHSMLQYCRKYMTPIQWEKSKHGEVAYQAAGGKRVLQHLPDRLKLELIDMGAHTSNEGRVNISQCWIFDKIKDNQNLKKDGSNFFEIAKRIK